MSRIKGTKSSAALIVAVIALVAALGGGAVAGVTISKLNNKERKQVKRLSKKQAKKLDRKIELTPGPRGEQGPRGPRGLVGPTEGVTSEPPPPTDPQTYFDDKQFTTSSAGRAFVIQRFRPFSSNCDTAADFYAWLEVDGVDVPGSRVVLSEGTRYEGLALAGITSNPLSAGEHTSKMAIRCISGDAGGGIAVGASTTVTAIVVGG